MSSDGAPIVDAPGVAASPEDELTYGGSPETWTEADREHFDRLLRPVLPVAFRYAMRLTGNKDAAMDLVQDASVLAFRGFGTFREGSSFKAWFLKIVTNRHFRLRKVAARTPSTNLDDAPELYLYEQAKRQGVPLDQTDPAAFVLDRLDADAVVAAMERLPEEYRVAATLHFLSEMSYEEIATTLDIPIGTVRSRLHRARKQLQVMLWRIAEERGLFAGKSTEEGD